MATLRDLSFVVGLALVTAACATAPGQPASGATSHPRVASPIATSTAPSSPPQESTRPTLQATPLPDVSPGSPALSPPSSHRLSLDFEDVVLGEEPADFIDVASEGPAPAWVYQGNWRVTADESGNHVFLHDDVRAQPAVSFQRYRGGALGRPDGQLPEVYYAEVAMRPIRSPQNYAPTGDQGVQFYYLDPQRYLEMVVKPDVIEVWEANGAEPRHTKGWKRLWFQSLTTKGGDVRRIGALVDVPAGLFTAHLDGRPLVTVSSTLLGARPAWFALRGIGNVVSFDNVVIEAR